MSSIEDLKLQSLLNIMQEIQPKTYIDDLAESGMLDEYLDNFFKNKIDVDQNFKDRIYDAYLNYSQEVNHNLEIYYLESMCNSLSYFIECTERCKIVKQ